MIDIISASIAAVAAMVCALISASSSRRHKRQEARAELRAKESRLMLDMISANIKLSTGTALAIKRGRANGELEEGLCAVRSCDEKYQQFLEEIAINHLTK